MTRLGTLALGLLVAATLAGPDTASARMASAEETRVAALDLVASERVTGEPGAGPGLALVATAERAETRVGDRCIRDYRPGLGTWTRRDPAGTVDGPNLYAYVANRPLTGVDPAGLSISVIGGGSSVINPVLGRVVPQDRSSRELADGVRDGLSAHEDLREFAGQVKAFGLTDDEGINAHVGGCAESSEPLVMIGISGGGDKIVRGALQYSKLANRRLDLAVLVDPVHPENPTELVFPRPGQFVSFLNLYRQASGLASFFPPGVGNGGLDGYRLVPVIGGDEQIDVNRAFSPSPPLDHYTIHRDPSVRLKIIERVASVLRAFKGGSR